MSRLSIRHLLPVSVPGPGVRRMRKHSGESWPRRATPRRSRRTLRILSQKLAPQRGKRQQEQTRRSRSATSDAILIARWSDLSMHHVEVTRGAAQWGVRWKAGDLMHAERFERVRHWIMSLRRLGQHLACAFPCRYKTCRCKTRRRHHGGLMLGGGNLQS